MKRLLSIARKIEDAHFDIDVVSWEDVAEAMPQGYDAIIVTGGDGALRRCVTLMHRHRRFLPILLNPAGSFNVVAKQHRISALPTLLDALAADTQRMITRPYYTLNDNEAFLFSAGNMGDLHHIFVAETLRFGLLKHGMAKYLLTFLLLLPMHVLLTPFMLASKRKFFIFTPVVFPKRLGSFYSDITRLEVDTQSDFHFVELDGDLVLLHHPLLRIRKEERNIELLVA